jgi:predicted Zn-dependent protease
MPDDQPLASLLLYERASTAVRTALSGAPNQEEGFMRTLTIMPYVIAAFVAGACGDKHPKPGDANAAEVTTVAPETASVSTPTGPVTAEPVSFESAKAAFAEKRYDEAVRLFTSYTSTQPGNVWGYYMLGLSAWKSGDRDAAVSAFTRALEQDSTHIKSRLNLGRVLVEQGKAQEALAQVEAAVTSDPASGEGYRMLGRVKGELGDSSGAIDAFKRAILLDERDAWAMNNLARVYISQGRFEEACGPLARAIEIDSTVAAFHTNLGLALERTIDRSSLAQGFMEQVKTWR